STPISTTASFARAPMGRPTRRISRLGIGRRNPPVAAALHALSMRPRGRVRSSMLNREVKANSAALTVRAVRAVGVEVPMTYALGTSAAKITTAALVLLDLDTNEGVTGRSYLFCFSRDLVPVVLRMVEAAGAIITGEKVAPVDLWDKLARRFKLIGVTGIVRMALAAIDVAAWDAVAIAASQPLARLLGASLRPIPAYNSCGLGLMTPQE